MTDRESSQERWRELEKFVGRKNELDIFQEILTYPKGTQRTLLIEGPGGQGKTWLIKEMLLAASEQPGVLALEPDKLLDMYSTTNRHLEGVLANIVERLQELIEDEHVFQPYIDAKDELEVARLQEDYSQEFLAHKVKELASILRNCLKTISAQQTVVLAFDTFENVQASEVGEWILSDDGLQMPNLICLVGTRNSLTAEKRKVYTAVRELPLNGLSDDEAMEFYSQYTKEELMAGREAFIYELNKKAEQNPLMLGLAILWLDLPEYSPEAVQKLSQEEFEQAVVTWLSPRLGPSAVWLEGIEYDEQMRQTLVLMAYMNRRFNRYFLECMVEAGYIKLDDVETDSLWEDLNRRKPDFFYVKERPEGELQLHDKLAEMLRKYVLVSAFDDMTGDTFRQFTGDVVDWYDGMIKGAAEKELLYIEQLAYLLRSDIYADCQQHGKPLPEICKNLESLIPDPKEVAERLESHRRRRSDVLARLLVNEVKIPLIQRFSDVDQYQLFKLLGQITSQTYLHEDARSYWQSAFEAAQKAGNVDWQVEALVGLHNSTYHTDPHESLRILNIAYQICKDESVEKRLPTVLYEIGFTYRRLHNLEQAIGWYQKAKTEATRLEDASRIPFVLNDEGYAYLLMGHIYKARILIRTARDLRLSDYQRLKQLIPASSVSEQEELEDRIKDAAEQLVFSYSTLGDLARFSGRLDEAIDRYSDALNLFEEASSSYWQARMYFSRGEAHRRQAITRYNTEQRSEKFQEFADQAEVDIRYSLELCRKLGYARDSVTALRRLGRLHHDRMFRREDLTEQLKLLDQARSLFEEALKIAESYDDTLEIMENLTELAFLTDDYLSILKKHDPKRFEESREKAYQDIKKFDQFIEQYEKAEDKIYQFPVFQHLLEIEQAAYYFVLENYDEALPKYISGYVGMAQTRGYGIARYLQHMDHLVSQLHKLYKMDKELCTEWSNTFLKAWEDAGLMDKRPELPEEIKTVMSTAFMVVDEIK